MPKWDASLHGGIWAGVSKEGGLVRKQTNEKCKGSEPCMDNKVAFTDEGLESFYSTFALGCAVWKSGVEMETLNDAVKRLQAQGALSSDSK